MDIPLSYYSMPTSGKDRPKSHFLIILRMVKCILNIGYNRYALVGKVLFSVFIGQRPAAGLCSFIHILQLHNRNNVCTRCARLSR